MPKPWEPGGSEADWADVQPSELEFWMTTHPTEVHLWPGGLVGRERVIPEGWVRQHLPPWLWVQSKPAIFVPDGRHGPDVIVPILLRVGFRHSRNMLEVTSSAEPPGRFVHIEEDFRSVDASLEDRIKTLFGNVPLGGSMPPANNGEELAEEIAGEGPYTVLTRVLEEMFRSRRWTVRELTAFLADIIPRVPRDQVEAAIVVALRDERFVGRPEGDVIRWEFRDLTLYSPNPAAPSGGLVTANIVEGAAEELLTFSTRVQRALSGAGWVPMGALYNRLVEGGWQPFEGHLSFDVHVSSVPRVESRGYAPHIEFRLGPSTEALQAMKKVVTGPSLVDRIMALFGNDLSVVHTAVVIQNRLRADTPVKTTLLQGTLSGLVREGRLYYLHNQESEGYRLIRREGVEAPSVWERLKGGEA